MALHRPYIRKDVREEVENRAQKDEKGRFLDANTGKPIEGQYDLGHKAGHEFHREVANAEKQGLSQKDFNNLMNNSDLYQLEDMSSNRSRVFEQKDDIQPIEEESSKEEETSLDVGKERTEAVSEIGENNNNTTEVTDEMVENNGKATEFTNEMDENNNEDNNEDNGMEM